LSPKMCTMAAIRPDLFPEGRQRVTRKRKEASAERDLDLLYVDGGVRLLASLLSVGWLSSSRGRAGRVGTPVIAPTPPALQV